jgi:hypothetical protein
VAGWRHIVLYMCTLFNECKESYNFFTQILKLNVCGCLVLVI